MIRLLDPCAGTGEPAAALALSLGAESFGIEVNEERANSARQRLDHVLHTSAFSVRLANGAFSVPLPESAVRLRRREPTAGARLPDEPDARALPGRGARIPHSAAPAGGVSPLPGESLHPNQGAPIPRPRVRCVSSDRALRHSQVEGNARSLRPVTPGGVEPGRSGAAFRRFGRTSDNRAVPSCPAMSCSPRSPSIRTRRLRKPDAAAHGSSLISPSSSGHQTINRSDR